MIRIIDVETTGADATKDAIVQVASIDLTKERAVVNSMSALVNPGRPIPPAASGVHHIIDADVADAPALAEVIDQFKGADFYVSHNAKFDRGFFAAAGVDLGQWVCTYKCALRVWPDLDGHSNQALRYHLGLVEPFGIPRASIHPHDAVSDCIVTAGILARLLDTARWADLVRWSSEPALFTRFTFGKHRGEPFSAVPADYLNWIITKSDLDEDVKFSASNEIARRRQEAA